MDEGFVVVSRLPDSGKSTLARQLSPALLPGLGDRHYYRPAARTTRRGSAIAFRTRHRGEKRGARY